MTKTILQQTLLFFAFVFLQVCCFNRVHIFGYATPIVYSYFILKLPVKLNRNYVILIAAAMGFIIDIFCSTPGLNMLSMVFVGFVRYWLIKLFIPKDMTDDGIPSFETFGMPLFMRYATIAVIFHIALLLIFETLSLLNPLMLFAHITGSAILTALLIFAFEKIHLPA
ncbi:MAG: rod shape-determining protein MreD [Candidatus Symbiothrix sp.]|jgi:rod shape-determining protein MreD|nr:rod shape-determining protein MreD [Candidatus Symbiothrix sp.]